jgi:hypothetical protein
MADAAKKTIEDFHAQIVEWRSRGVSLNQIVANLKKLGFEVTRNKVNWYCGKAKIPVASPAPPPAREPVPTRLFEKPPPAKKPQAPPQHQPPKQPQTPVFPGVSGKSASGGSGAISLAGSSFEVSSKHPSAAPAPPPPVPPAPVPASLFPPPTPVLQPVKPVVKPPVAKKSPAEFPELDCHRVRVLAFALAGCLVSEIEAVFRKAFDVVASVERWQEYIDALFAEVFPPGKVAPHLFEIKEHAQVWEQDLEMLTFDQTRDGDRWRCSDFFEGTLILGSMGSGSGRTIASLFLQAGWGGLILTTKVGEAQEWHKLAGLCGRDADVCMIRPEGMLRMDVLAYESQRPGQGGNLTENLLHFFRNLVSALATKRGKPTNAEFWQNTGDQLLRNLIEAHLLAELPLTIDSLARFVINAPRSAAEAAGDDWQRRPVFGEALMRAQELAATEDKQHALQILKDYWLHDYATLNADTRSCITIAFSAMIDAIRSSAIHKLIASQTTITPEAILNGKILIVDLPVNEFHEAGLLVQTAWKYLFERAVLRRSDMARRDGVRPVFLWEDECHNFMIDYDPEFNRVARDRRVARVMLTQNINNLYDAFGGSSSARVKVDSILGTINTRIYHANGDLATNKWASESIGTHEKTLTDTSVTPPAYQGIDPIKAILHPFFSKPSRTTSAKTIREPRVHPHEFSELSPGGKTRQFVCEAIITQVGRRFVGGLPYRRVRFNQIILPEEVYSDEELQSAIRHQKEKLARRK